MTLPDDPMIPVTVEVSASALALVDGLAERMLADREVRVLNARVDRDTVLRLAIERGVAALEKGLTMRVLRRENADIFDPVTLLRDAHE